MKDCESQIRPALEGAFANSIQIKADSEDCRITVPFERSDRDAVTLWIRENGDGYVISDEGETYGMLYLSNINIDQPRRRKRLESVKSRFDLDKAEREIRIRTDQENLGARIIDAIQAVQSISYLTYTRQEYTKSDFKEDVGEFLTESGFYYTPHYDVQGASETHVVDFNIHDQPKLTFLEAIHAESPSSAKSIAERTGFKWTDIRRANADVNLIAVLDNESGEYDSRTETILENYSDHFIPWSAKDTIDQALTA